MVREYYQLSGRHEKTGQPFIDTLKQLGLEKFSEWVQLDQSLPTVCAGLVGISPVQNAGGICRDR